MPKSKLAIWSFVLVLVAYFLIIVSLIIIPYFPYSMTIFTICSSLITVGVAIGFIAFILGIIGLITINRNKNQTGKGFAIAAIILGLIMIIVSIWYVHSLFTYGMG